MHKVSETRHPSRAPISARRLGGQERVILAVFASLLLSSCAATTDSELQAGLPGFNAAVAPAADGATPTQTSAAPAAGYNLSMDAEGNTALPEQIAYLPAGNPVAKGAEPAIAAVTAEEKTSDPEQAAAVQEAPAKPEAQAAETTQQAAAPAQQAAEATPAADAPAQQQDAKQYLTNGTMPEPAEQPKKKGFFANLFGGKSAAAPKAAAPKPLVAEAAKPQQFIENTPKPLITQGEEKPVITLASAGETSKGRQLALASLDGPQSGAMDSLPGVRQTALFEIRRRSGVDDESDVDLHEEVDGSYQVASAAGLARLAPNGLLKQTESVDVACLKPSLLRVLKLAEARFGKKMIVTSGYRNPQRNRAARGAKNSMHMYCAAADVQMPGVSKFELASFFRTMPGRGGVGTYCHTDSVHVDVGPERDWNWRCRRR